MKGSPLPGALRTLAALVAGLVASALLAEAAVWLLLGPQVRFPRRVVEAPWGLRYNEPGSRYGHSSPDVDVHFRINGQGMRDDREFAYAKPEGVTRIVSLGDSFTVGYEVEAHETFSAVLEQRLEAAGHEVQVLNAGVSGFSTAEALLYLRRELWKYAPDLVLVSFYGNDLVDNVRTGLFDLEEGRLVERAERYVPGGGLGDLLNTNPLLAWLAEHSNAFALVKERLTVLVKRGVVSRNLEQLDLAESPESPEGGAPAGRPSHQGVGRRLALALFEELYRETRSHEVPLLIHSIPTRRGAPLRLVDMFPRDGFDLDRPDLHYLAAKDVLEPFLGDDLLYWTRSHWHWTPRSHRLAGEALATLILERGLLEES